ncbi:hypothetical protein R7P67_12350 [Vibrio sp. Vb0937]|uniref:hypothetical protein n=1 Tax=unclassified Vibrio TaxID=2614977 RepID=UPI002964C032|nr:MULTISPECIES: hypothetical protein [unclassified Vibrio]MDW1825811.1 hypothetical protein [Vibrio sp. Vb0937]MDW3187020.1 hypothetical protein [Vibrio sp. Vb0932]
MSIAQQVDDAKFLADNKRYLGALTNLMLAVAASSRKTFPKGKTKSLEDPNKNMSDREAFTLFVGGRINQILFCEIGSAHIGNSGISISFKGKQHDVAYILYKYYRCELVHEGELPAGIEFGPSSSAHNLLFRNSGLNVSIGCGSTMVLDYGWIELLIEVIVYAPCNAKAFGIRSFNLIPIEGTTEKEHCDLMVQTYGITSDRFQLLKEVARHLTPIRIVSDDDEQLIRGFGNLVSKEIINRGSIVGLSRQNLSDINGNLLPKGLNILKYIGVSYNLVEVDA